MEPSARLLDIERMYVQGGIYDAFVPRFVDRVKSMKLAADYEYETEMGALISQIGDYPR